MTAGAFELIRGDYSLRRRHRGVVAAVGGFDSLHVGHQELIKRALELAQEHKASPAVVLFEPLPDEFFGRAGGRVQTLRRRLEVLRDLGVARVLCLRFNRRIARMTAEDFIRRLLVDGLAVRHIVVGDRFRFGRRGLGTEDTLRAAGDAQGFGVTAVDEVAVGGRRVSTTRVRDALGAGDMAEVERCLGRAYVLDARVGRGAGRGAGLGFPTANLIVAPPPPLRGVFVADITTPDGVVRRGALNAGVVPTFDGARYKIEAHIPGFDGQLYAHRLRVSVSQKLRGERKFPSADALKAQLQKDVEAALGAPARTVEQR